MSLHLVQVLKFVDRAHLSWLRARRFVHRYVGTAHVPAREVCFQRRSSYATQQRRSSVQFERLRSIHPTPSDPSFCLSASMRSIRRRANKRSPRYRSSLATIRRQFQARIKFGSTINAKSITSPTPGGRESASRTSAIQSIPSKRKYVHPQDQWATVAEAFNKYDLHVVRSGKEYIDSLFAPVSLTFHKVAMSCELMSTPGWSVRSYPLRIQHRLLWITSE